MKILKRKILGPITLLHLIALSTVSTVFGAAMLYYTWTINLTFAQTDVTFYRWSDNATAGTITLTYNYYIDVITRDDNATWGIWNRGTTNKTVYLWADHPSSPDEIDYFLLEIEDSSNPGSIVTWWTTTDWSNIWESNAVSWLAIAGTKYTLKIQLKGSSTAGWGEYIRLQLKTAP